MVSRKLATRVENKYLDEKPLFRIKTSRLCHFAGFFFSFFCGCMQCTRPACSSSSRHNWYRSKLRSKLSPSARAFLRASNSHVRFLRHFDCSVIHVYSLSMSWISPASGGTIYLHIVLGTHESRFLTGKCRFQNIFDWLNLSAVSCIRRITRINVLYTKRSRLGLCWLFPEISFILLIW